MDPAAIVRRALAQHALGPHVSLFAAGKAAAPMASAAAELLGPTLLRGVVIAPSHVERDGAPLETYRGGHPMPNEDGARGAQSLLRIATALGADDVLLCLISGGASALASVPAEGLSLHDVQTTTNLLLRAGSPIEELNCVRKHIDRLKGGRLAVAAFPAAIEALILSDVIGDSPATIASGLTVPDPTTVQDAIAVLQARDVWRSMPPAVRTHLERGADESPKPGDPRFARARARIVGSNSIAADAAAEHARGLGYATRIVTTSMSGEAAVVGDAIAREVRAECDSAGVPVALIYGGETTVTVRGSGSGGRNQELALAAAIRLNGDPSAAVASLGTDGIDGPTDAAGAIAHGEVVVRAALTGADPLAALANNDAYHFWRSVGGLVVTGPTGTNVMDIVVATAHPVTA